MTKPRALTLASLIATVSFAALSATAGQAQVPPRAGPAPAAASAARPAPPSRAEIEKRMADRRAERAKDLATVLRVTPAQKSAFDAYIASRAPGPRANRADRMRGGQDRRDMTTAQRLDEQTRRNTERQAAQTKRTEALRTFYTALSPEQKQVFDALNRLNGDRGGHGRRFDGRKFAEHRGPGGPRGQFGPGAPGGWGPPR